MSLVVVPIIINGGLPEETKSFIFQIFFLILFFACFYWWGKVIFKFLSILIKFIKKRFFDSKPD